VAERGDLEEDTKQAFASVQQEHRATDLPDVLKSESKGKKTLSNRPPLLWGLAAVVLILIASAVFLRSYGEKPAAQIIIPKVGERVDAVTTVRGTSKNLGSTRKLWIVVKSEEGSYYSHTGAAEVSDSSGEWQSVGCVGPREDFDKEFEILAVAVNSKAQGFLAGTGQTSCTDGFSVFPNGVLVLSTVKVSRNPKWWNDYR
jgi:hypothetical protein